MGVYIKGMEMPTSCRACLYSRTDIRNVDWCVLTEKDLPCDCPIIPVPPHGRLIDADKMRESIRRQAGLLKLMGGELSDLAETLEKGFLQEIDNAPTIIPAEEDE